MSRRHRLTRAIELDRVRQSGKRFRTEHLEARSIASLFPYCRVAVVVGKYGHTIVSRNKVRRRLRELSRMLLIPGCGGLDVLIKALPQAYTASFEELQGEIVRIGQHLLSNRE